MQNFNSNLFSKLSLLICVVIIGCTIHSTKSNHIIIPSDLMQLNFDYDTVFNGSNSRMKIISYYDSTICNDCVLRNIGSWYKVANLAENNCDIVSLLIIFSPKKDELNELLHSLNANPLDYPLFVDTVGAFSSNNPTLAGTGNYVCLLDSLNNVIIEGNPLFGDDLFLEYESIINNYRSNETSKK